MSKPLVSIIVPVYNTKKYIEKCIKSILGQTYQNIELILVNDGSRESEEQIINRYAKKDPRIVYIKSQENQGLFRTRVKGVKSAKGKYIAFVDSDDYINIDFIRLLVQKAEMEQSDITFATTVLNTPKEKKVINVFQDVALHKLPLVGDEVRKAYFEQEGVAYVWHTIWNKLYSKALWDRCLPYFEQMNEHVVMTEDIAFSSILFYFAQKAVRVENSVYFYCQHSEASTSTQNMSFSVFQKRVSDIISVFTFLEEFYSDKEKWFKDKLAKFKNYYARIWKRGIININDDRQQDAEELVSALCSELEDKTTTEDGYFNLAQAPYSSKLDEIKEEIWHSKQKYMSFDIFDTLITRPFFNPTDLFYLLDKTYEDKVSSNTSFYTIRIEGEQAARETICARDRKEDISIDQIYDYISEAYDIPEDICNTLKQAEQNLEVAFSQPRKTVHEIYELALLSGKKVIFVSDMYLGKETIERILEKNGYDTYEKLFVSSQYGKLKVTGNLYKQVFEELTTKPSEIIHMGDNINSDIGMASKIGITAIYMPKAIDVFSNNIEELNTNRCLTIGKEVAGTYKSEKNFEKISGYGTMVAMIANKYFDNPFRPFHPMTDFNMDAYFMGYYTLGMNLVAQIQWIEKLREEKEFQKLIFTARDGYLLNNAFRLYLDICNEECLSTDYMYTSRRAMLPMMLQSKTDFMNLPIIYQKYTPNMILELLAFCATDMRDEEWQELCNELGILGDKAFRNIAEYHAFMKIFFVYRYDEAKHERNKKSIRNYWSKVSSEDHIYDMGYSAGIHHAICKAAKSNSTALFIHTDKNKHKPFERRGQFKIESLIESMPNISGLMREHFFSDLCGSCIGYQEKEDRIVPILEEEVKDYVDTFPLVTMQQAALDFVQDFYSRFCEYLPYIDIRVSDVEMPFEGLLCSPTKIDTKIFMASYFEDKVYGAIEKINIRDFWLQLLIGLPGYQGADIAKNFDKFMQEKGKTKLAFFGTGRMCRDILESNPLPVTVFLDNDKSKNGQKWYNGEIFLPGEVENIKGLFIVIVCAAYMEIEEQLEDMGLVKFQDYVNYMELF